MFPNAEKVWDADLSSSDVDTNMVLPFPDKEGMEEVNLCRAAYLYSS
jgi:hypothetical protein